MVEAAESAVVTKTIKTTANKAAAEAAVIEMSIETAKTAQSLLRLPKSAFCKSHSHSTTNRALSSFSALDDANVLFNGHLVTLGSHTFSYQRQIASAIGLQCADAPRNTRDLPICTASAIYVPLFKIFRTSYHSVCSIAREKRKSASAS